MGEGHQVNEGRVCPGQSQGDMKVVPGRFGEDWALGEGVTGAALPTGGGGAHLTLDVPLASWWGGFIQCPCGGPCSQKVLCSCAWQSRGGGSPGNPGLWAPQTLQPSPQAPAGGDTTLEIRGRSGLHAVSEKCNTIN